MKSTKHLRWAAAGLAAGLVIGGGALAQAASSRSPTTTPATDAKDSIAPAGVVFGAPRRPAAAQPRATFPVGPTLVGPACAALMAARQLGFDHGCGSTMCGRTSGSASRSGRHLAITS